MYEKIYVSYFKPLYMSEAHQEQGPLPTFPCHELRGGLPGGSNLLLTHCTLAHLFTRIKTREERRINNEHFCKMNVLTLLVRLSRLIQRDYRRLEFLSRAVTMNLTNVSKEIIIQFYHRENK